MTTRRGNVKTESTVSSEEYVGLVKENAVLRTANKDLTGRLITVEDKFKSKPAWQSKTVAFNLTALVAYLAANVLGTEVSPEFMVLIITAGNAILRYVTKGDITLT